MGIIMILLLIGVIITLLVVLVILLLAWDDGRDDGALRYREYDNKYVMPFALLYDIGYTQSDPANKKRVAIKNKQRFNRE